MDHISDKTIKLFQTTVWDYYHAHRRTMPWRESDAHGQYDPYKIMVSELMLQQTQVPRVIPKYQEFLRTFPTIQTLATASLSDVLRVWQGLGYNRRAKFLRQSAIEIMQRFQSIIPSDVGQLQGLPGIGVNTAGAICVYAFSQPSVFLETNIRTVYIHHFFADQKDVADKDLKALVKQTLPKNDYRNWFYALMDYGAYLKATSGNKSRQAKAYTKQSKFKGSLRQLRGQVLLALHEEPKSLKELAGLYPDKRLHTACDQLLKEGLIHQIGSRYYLG